MISANLVLPRTGDVVALGSSGDHERFSRWESLAITFNVPDPRSESEECAALLIEPSQ